MMFGSVLVGLGMLAAGIAQGSTGDQSRTFDALADCRKIVADRDRLACFDRAADAFVAARSKGEVVVIDRTKVIERKQARFGLAASTREMFGGGREDQSTEVKTIETTIRSLTPARGGHWAIEFENGSVWQTLDVPNMVPKKGQSVKLTATALGGYRASINGRISISMKRLR